MMTAHTITVTVPEDLYNYLEARSRATQRSVEDVLVQTARIAVPAPIEADLPEGIRRELEAMAHLSDVTLWLIALSIANTDKIALSDVLLERNRAGTITPEGMALLAQLREEADALMLRKAQAFVLLKGRGHALPTLDSLPVPVV
jgi:hypothetical protein